MSSLQEELHENEVIDKDDLGETSLSSDSDADETLADLQRKLQQLEKEKKKQAERAEKKELRDRIAMLQKELDLESSGGQHHLGEAHRTAKPKIDDLRKQPDLQQAVKSRMRQLGMDSSDDSDTDSEARAAGIQVSRRGKSRHVRSGISSSISDVCITNQQIYAHAALQFSYASRSVNFHDLSFQLYIAGELEIISMSGISEVERNGRLALMKLLAYKCERFDWAIIREAFGAWVQQIERGIKKWSDDPTSVVSHILEDHIHEQKVVRYQKLNKSDLKSKFKSKSPEGNFENVWFCSNYNRNKCKHTSPHEAQINGQIRSVQHICASCWRKDKIKQFHPECSSACPLASE
jgi:hypothetical protein